jgi:hypothetical protein
MLGTWKMNLAKSKYTPGPAPQSQTSTIEAAGNGVKNVTKITTADGKETSYQYTATSLDGKEFPITGSGPGGGHTIAIKRVNANTYDSTITKSGKVVQTSHVVYSKDGKTRTITAKGTSSSGQATTNISVYERQN